MYLHWDQQKIDDFSSNFITEMYGKGYVFTRLGRGVMHQTRSVRIDLSQFEPSSENRRIIKKTAGLDLIAQGLPLKDYSWTLGKLAKDFYDTKFGPGIMSAQKVKEMLTDAKASNFNLLLRFGENGYAICYANDSMIHYSYPFYDLKVMSKDTGMGMMIRAIQYAKESGLKYAYLGSLKDSAGLYKLQFSGLEWFDGKRWSDDEEKAKALFLS